MVKDSAAAPEKTRMVFAYTNRDVVERGEAHSFETKPGAEFATGGRVQFGSKTIRPRPAS